jgi:pantoate--beta-alanine ligase
MHVLRTVAEAAAARRDAAATGPLGLVPTMGYLHDGHLSLVRASKLRDAWTMVSIFVNPAQFGPAEDFAKYPRDEVRDLAMLESAGVDCVFAPPPAAVYPPGYDTWVEPGAIKDRLEGAVRPGHFRGVCTVVLKLFNIVRPDRAYFGQKDYQQCVVIRNMAADLNLDVDVQVLPTVREADGLAMSSRNVYLSPEERRGATVLYRSLVAARALVAGGERRAAAIREAVASIIGGEPLAAIDYISVCDRTTLTELEAVSSEAVALVAVRFGRTRLLDNMLLP